MIKNLYFKTLSVMAVLLTAFAVSTYAGGNTTYYSRMNAKAVGAGKVYASTNDNTPTDEQYATESSADQSGAEQEHAYYLHAQAEANQAFKGWYTDEECNTLRSLDNPYRYTITATGTSAGNRTQATLYAKFEAMSFTSYARLTVKAVGEGKVFVATSASAEASYADEVSAGSAVSNEYAHTFYLFSEPGEGMTLLGWYADEECTTPLMLDGNSYTLESESTNESTPTEQTIYAKFGANPYQIPNPSFEQWNNALNEPNPVWHSFPTGIGSLIGIAGSGLQATRVEGRTGYAAQIKSVSKMGVGANGNLTTGRINAGSMTATDASGNYNFSDLDNEGFYLTIDGQPDAIEFYAKFSAASNNSNGCGHMQAYMHKACNRFQDPRNGNGNQDEYLLAAAGTNIATASDWTYYNVPFTYEDYTIVQLNNETKYMLISFSTNPTPGQSYGDVLTIDDVRLVYSSELKSVKYNGVDMPIEDGKIYVGEDAFDMDLLEITSGRAARVEYDLNDEGQLVVVIYGQDYELNPTNTHTYTLDIVQGEAPIAVNFDPAKLYTLRAAGTDVYATTQTMVSTSDAGSTYTFGTEPESFSIVKTEGGYTIQSENGKYIGLNQWDVVDNVYVWNIVAVEGLENTYQILNGDTGKGLGWDNAADGQGIYTDKTGFQWVIEVVETWPVDLELTYVMNADGTEATVTVEGLTGRSEAHIFYANADEVDENSEGEPLVGNTFVVKCPETTYPIVKPGDEGYNSGHIETRTYDVAVTVREYDYDKSPVVLYSTGSLTVRFVLDIDVSVATLSSDTEQAPIYNLNGQRVNATHRGIYIEGGQKVVRK